MEIQISYFKHVYVLNTRTSLYRRKSFPEVTNYAQHWLFGASFVTIILIKIFYNIQTKNVQSLIHICDSTYMRHYIHLQT
jgi:hypothetical protein